MESSKTKVSGLRLDKQKLEAERSRFFSLSFSLWPALPTIVGFVNKMLTSTP